MIIRSLLSCLFLCLASEAVAHPGQHDQLVQINRRIAQAPAEQALLMQRGRIYSEGGQYDQALADYRQAQQLGPPARVNFELGVLYYRMSNYERATAYLDEYLEHFPNYPPAYDYLARVARDAGDYDLAVANLQAYFRLQARPNPGHYLSAAKMLEERGRYTEALEILDQGLATLGVVPQLQRYAIGLELQQRQPALAIARLQSLGPVLGESPSWKLDMAALLVLADRQEEAAGLARTAQAELVGLRSTPARLALQRQAADLIARHGQPLPR